MRVLLISSTTIFEDERHKTVMSTTHELRPRRRIAWSKLGCLHSESQGAGRHARFEGTFFAEVVHAQRKFGRECVGCDLQFTPPVLFFFGVFSRGSPSVFTRYVFHFVADHVLAWRVISTSVSSCSQKVSW